MSVSIFFIFIISLLLNVYLILYIKSKAKQVTSFIKEMKDEHGTKRMLISERDLFSPVVFEINAVIADYEQQVQQLKKEINSSKELMTSLSHDIRTPLTTLIGYLDAIQLGIVTGLEKEEYIEVSRKKAYALKTYVDRLFEWFKFNSDDYTMDMQNVEIVELTRTLLIDWVPVFEKNKIKFDFDFPEQGLYTLVDKFMYKRVIDNLISNVMEHSEADFFHLSLGYNASKITIKIMDNGVGIDETSIQKVFDRLYKVDQGRSAKGSGLGLAIVRDILQKIDGTITVDSVVNNQTVFTISLNRT
ncbi:sensor histidine kinase [Enterococcus sp. DIV0876]|uniref:sensor histidine kinase n=1 Tax=Enterococcus sp. DIV0876 TaxID=2774633 RepID=UPI003D2FF0AF